VELAGSPHSRIARREQLLASGGSAIRLLGSPSSPDAFRLRELLTRNQVPFTWIDVEDDPAIAELLRHLGLEPADLPAVEKIGMSTTR
jgi:thioredoxin reductase (NADPH)